MVSKSELENNLAAFEIPDGNLGHHSGLPMPWPGPQGDQQFVRGQDEQPTGQTIFHFHIGEASLEPLPPPSEHKGQWHPGEPISGSKPIYLQKMFSSLFQVVLLLPNHVSLEQNLTIRSHDCGKEGHFCNCGDTSIHLPLTRSAQPSGQLSLFLLNEFNSLWGEFT